MEANFITKNYTGVSNRLVYLIEDDNSFRTSIETLLRLENYNVISYEDPMDFLKHDLDPFGIILMDMCFPNISGVDTYSLLIKKSNKLPIIFISGECTTHQVIDAFKLGVVDFLIKPFEAEYLLNRIEFAFDRLENKNKSIYQNKFDNLSPREKEMFKLIVKGYNNKQLSDTLKLAVSTVKEYKANVFRKLNVDCLSDLISINQSIDHHSDI